MSMEINRNVTSQIMDLKTSAQGVTRKNDKATNNVEEYYEKLCKKFPQISFNTGGTCTANKVVVNISPECLKKMANDPEFAKEVEFNLSGEVAANAQIHSWARRDGIEVYGRTVTYDANGKRESGYGMRTANPSNGNNGIFGSLKSKKREQEEYLEEIREKRKKQEEYLEELREKRRKKEEFEERLEDVRKGREAHFERFIKGNSSMKQYQNTEMLQDKSYSDPSTSQFISRLNIKV